MRSQWKRKLHSRIGRAFFPFVVASFAFPQTKPASPMTPDAAGITFVEGSTSTVMVERDGKKYLVDLVTREVREQSPPESSSSLSGQNPSPVPQSAESKPELRVYRTGDDFVYSVPTGRRLDRHGLYINFSHRFPFEAAFTGVARGATLLGLDDFSVSSFGLRFGVTSRFFVSAYRSPSVIGRPIELMGGYTLFDEKSGNPLNASVRFSVDGQDNFSRNFTENFELTLSKSLGRRAQLYAVPTLSLHNRPVLSAPSALTDPPPYQPCAAPLAAGIDPSFRARPCANTFSLGVAGAVDIRPTVALIAETIPTLANGSDLGIHRPEYAFGIQKKIWRHAFTFAFSNGPGTIVSQRAGTRATFLQDRNADTLSGMFVGFDITRQVF